MTEARPCTVCGVRERRPAHSWCRKCHSDYERERVRKNKDVINARRKERYSTEKNYVYRLKQVYGITLEDKQQMSDAQGGICAICGIETFLVVDHDHDSGKVRGLLCSKCNLGIGQLQDNPEYLRRAIAYLEAWADACDRN